jgi:UDP-N-acetylmuramoyl-L-alanyl-D-glutamate--2,6-diaminopimelate ligase
MGEIANRFFDYPSRAVRVVGVTGTNGKTTVAWLLAQCLQRLGRPSGYAGTLGYGMNDVDVAEGMTTPDVIELHRRLAEFRDAGANFAVIEVSSHALAQHRIDGVAVDSALFTNLSRDHLDYHGDMQAYAEAKAALFLDAGPARRIVNMDTEFGTELASRCGPEAITVSMNFDRVANGRPYVFVRSVVAKQDGSEIAIRSSWGDGSVWLPIPGDFNVANAVLVLAFLLSEGVPFDEAKAALSQVTAPPGRMQRVAVGSGPDVYVDYAHTPNALEVALRALRPHCRGELWCVFGCGGDRDSGKRPLMARVAEQLADRIVVTSDNPRSEDAGEIITAIVDGFSDQEQATIIEDRATAIAWAIGNTAVEDVVLLAGKGHENYQLTGDQRRDFSDYGVAVANLRIRSQSEEDAT